MGTGSPNDSTSAPPAAAPRRAPGVLLRRLSGPLDALLACGVVRRAEGDVIELFPNAQEVAEGGMAGLRQLAPG